MRNRTFSSSEASKDKEIIYLKQQLTGLEILLDQNARLEEEVNRLCSELDNATHQVIQRGYLYKWREREIGWAAKWVLRYFTLQGSILSYYIDEHERRPKRTLDLSRCVVRQEGTKKQGQFHVFSIYMVRDDTWVENMGEEGSEYGDDDTNTVDLESEPESLNLLLRLSCSNSAEAAIWLDMLEQGCAVQELAKSSNEYSESSTLPSLPQRAGSNSSSLGLDIDTGLSIDDSETLATDLSPVVLQRIGSSSGVLKKSASRQTMSRRILARRSPKDFSMSGTRLQDLLRDGSGKDGSKSSSPSKGNKESSGMIPSPLVKPNQLGLRQRTWHASEPSTDSTSDNKTLTLTSESASTTSTGTSPRGSGGSAGSGGAAPTKRAPKQFPGSRPMHVKASASPLSHDYRPGDINYRGFFNLALIILFISHARIIIDSHKKYGFVPAWQKLLSETSKGTSIIGYAQSRPGMSLLSWLLQVLISYSLELSFCEFDVPEHIALIISFVSGTINIVLPTIWVWYSGAHPGARCLYLFQTVVMWMKLISYHHCNRDLRMTRKALLQRKGSMDNLSEYADDNAKPAPLMRQSSKQNFLKDMYQDVKDLKAPILRYPFNISFYNLLYFIIAPTLTYQLNFPRSRPMRWKHVLTILFRMMVVSGLILFFCEQYIMPTLENSMEPLHNSNILGIMERILKLSIPNTYVWLLCFYFYFHLWLNLLAEVTAFGDRMFYKDWWNARTIESYWRNWNLPVHNWILRHLYFPLTRMGASRFVGTFVAFLFSALMHELVISGSFGRVSMHAFVGMLGQAPLTFVSTYLDRRFDNSFFGNALFWLSFCVIGQPMGVILYAYDGWKGAG